MLVISSLISGLAIGSMYGLIALGFHVTWSVSRTVNFAQGTAMMLGAVLFYVFLVRAGLFWPLSLVLALLCCAAYGVLIERLAVRPFVARGSESWLMATVAAGIVVDNVVMFTFGREPRAMPSPFQGQTLRFGDVGVDPLQLIIPVVGLSLALAFWLVTRRTRVGKAMLAVVQNRSAAELMGIRVQRMITLSFAVSAVLAAVAGILIAPLYTVSASMGFVFGIKAFAVGILGGLDNAWGVVVAGILFGLAESLITAFLGSGYTGVLSFSLVIAALFARPHGLFGRAEVQKV